jgi:hypothetical protein
LGKRAGKLDIRVHAMIWQKHLDEQPSEANYRAWVIETAEQYGVEPVQVRRVITTESESLQYQLNQATATETMRLARRYGLTKEKAFRAMEAGLNATRSETLRGEKGTLMNEVTNRPRVFSQPDFNARAKFLDIFTGWMGMNAPEQSEIKVNGNVNVNLSSEQIQQRILAIGIKAGLLDAGGNSRVIDVGRGTEREEVSREPALLAPERDTNQG